MLRWPKQAEELLESVKELDKLSRVVPFQFKEELDESVKGLDELIRQIAIVSSHRTR